MHIAGSCPFVYSLHGMVIAIELLISFMAVAVLQSGGL